MNDQFNTEDYINQKVQGGYILKDGTPIKCYCGNVEFRQVNVFHGGGCIEQYDLECVNEGCGKIVGSWAYGYWMV